MPIKKVNFYISYIKGVAFIDIVLIHLIDWSNIQLPFAGLVVKELFYAGVFLFVLTAGSTIFIAYSERPSFAKSSVRLIYRGGQLLFFYYLYSVIKFFVFNFATQPFYSQFINAGTFTVSNILAFRSFSVPITILITFAFLLALSPAFLYIQKRLRYPKATIALLITALFIINYVMPTSLVSSPIFEFLYGHGYILFPLALWLFPFLLGFFLAQIGFEKQKKNILVVGGALTLLYGGLNYVQHLSLFPSYYEFPLAPYYMAFGLLVMGLLLYAFDYLQHISAKWVQCVLVVIRLLGDNSLYLYIYHWIVIDITIWLFASHVALIWLTAPLFFVVYLLLRKKKLNAVV